MFLLGCISESGWRRGVVEVRLSLIGYQTTGIGSDLHLPRDAIDDEITILRTDALHTQQSPQRVLITMTASLFLTEGMRPRYIVANLFSSTTP
jgi:hypothetical protein